MKKSKIWQMPKEELQRLLNESDSFVDVFRKIGVDPYNGNHKTLNRRIEEEGLSLVKLKANRSNFYSNRQLPKLSDSEVFCENSSYNRQWLKKRILDQNLMPYLCAECGVGDKYNDKPLKLQLDHKNGINDDSRLDNLRFLCPNCHSQTPTFGTKRFKGTGAKKIKAYETDEQKKQRIELARKFNPAKEELELMVCELPMTEIGRIFGVSDTAVRKRCRLLGIRPIGKRNR